MCGGVYVCVREREVYVTTRGVYVCVREREVYVTILNHTYETTHMNIRVK